MPAPHLQPGGAAVQRVAPPDVAVAAVEAHMVEIVEVWLLIKPGREGPEGSRRGPGVARGRQGGAKGAAPQPRAGGVVAPCDPREPVARVMGLGAEARADDPPRGRGEEWWAAGEGTADEIGNGVANRERRGDGARGGRGGVGCGVGGEAADMKTKKMCGRKRTKPAVKGMRSATTNSIGWA